MKSPIQQFLAAVKELRDGLLDIPKKLSVLDQDIKEQTEAIRTTAHRQWEEGDPPIAVRFPNDETKKSRTEANRHYDVQRSIKRATWCAFFAAAIYALLTYRLLTQARKSTDAAEQAARIAEENFQQSGRITRLEERPWVGVDTIKLLVDGDNLISPGQHGVYVIVHNFGKVPALRTTYPFDVKPRASEPRNPTYNPRDYSRMVIFPTAIVPSQVAVFQISDDDVKAFASGKKRLYIYGLISYEDSFNSWYFTKFCGVYSPPTHNFTVCAGYNVAY